MVFEPERRLSCTGMLSTTPPPPVLGWSSEIGAAPFTLREMTRWPVEPPKTQDAQPRVEADTPDSRVAPGRVAVRDVEGDPLRRAATLNGDGHGSTIACVDVSVSDGCPLKQGK